jgi:hypothetical protein
MLARALYLPTDVSPEEIFQAIGRLRKEARDEIDRLIGFLDKTDDYVSRELEDEDDREPVGDDEPSLGSFDAISNQDRAWKGTTGQWLDCEKDDSDDEPSLAALENHVWAPVMIARMNTMAASLTSTMSRLSAA